MIRGAVMSDKKIPAGKHSPVSLATYQALVDRCAKGRLNFQIANGSALHARILIDKLFEIANSEVSLVSGSLRQKSRDDVAIYSHDRVLASARAFLTKVGTKLNIVLQTGRVDGGAENAFLRDVIGDRGRQGLVTVYLPKEGNLSAEETPHFMISDRSAYRFETGTNANPEVEAITAIANFGDGETALTLSDIFEDIVSLAGADDNMNTKKTFRPGETYSFEN